MTIQQVEMPADNRDLRVLILMSTLKDSERIRDGLASAGLAAGVCRDLDELCRGIGEGAGVALLMEESLAGKGLEHLQKVLRAQPAWSDFPLVIVTRAQLRQREHNFQSSMNVALVERPIRLRSLISVTQAAMRSRRHQYAVRGHLAERERQADALRENEARLRFVLEAGRLGSWELDIEQGTMKADAICKANFGRPLDRDFTYRELFDAIHPDDRDRVRDAVMHALEHRSDYDVEYRNVWPDGSIHWVLVRGRISSDSHQPKLMSGISLDVTLVKQAEFELRDADRRKDEFLALLAHELRNPLAPLRNGLEVLRLSAGNAAALAGASAIMERQLAHMVRLIDDLLDVSRISRNKLELRRSRVPLAEVIAAAAETVRPLAEAAEHELVISLPAKPIYLDADLTRLAQVFSNLLSNSVKYTKPHGRIWLSAELRDGEVVVSVRDNGIGIPAGSQRSIFDMFSQVDRSLERTTGGLGIGLALVKGLVEMHGGTVDVTSDGPDTGSTFTVRLQAAAAPPTCESVSTNGHDSARVKRRILVVDDNRDSATTMEMMLRLFGDEVATAHDGQEGIEAAERFRPDVILMDVGMPRLNGYEATRIIRQQPWGGKIAIIALTGWGQDSDRQSSKAAGCDAHLVKPVNKDDLHKALSKLPLAMESENPPATDLPR